MMIVRHAEHRDLDDIYILAGKSGIGLTSLPQNKEILSARIARTQKTLAGQATPSHIDAVPGADSSAVSARAAE